MKQRKHDVDVIYEGVLFDIAADKLVAGERLQSQYLMAIEQAVHPNTVLKAMNRLSDEGILGSVPQSHRFVVPRAVMRAKRKAVALVDGRLFADVADAARAGYSDDQIMATVRDAIGAARHDARNGKA